MPVPILKLRDTLLVTIQEELSDAQLSQLRTDIAERLGKQRLKSLIIDVSATAAYTGTFVGTSTINGTLIIHADGSTNFHDTEVFTGTVNGVPGTVTFNPYSIGGSSHRVLV